MASPQGPVALSQHRRQSEITGHVLLILSDGPWCDQSVGSIRSAELPPCPRSMSLPSLPRRTFQSAVPVRPSYPASGRLSPRNQISAQQDDPDLIGKHADPSQWLTNVFRRQYRDCLLHNTTNIITEPSVDLLGTQADHIYGAKKHRDVCSR